ncbi:hypothetical protein Hypma_004240 [Hypsizygus marmoreus]|uniref:Uncharacterized protein n=1 Tax=Hypsizygus marmoreus TaxID=39966 RepID=A0A369J9K9_HYPMA|nr:hypothetical protein Hypma_004240 [Hypsizygus marmoreus]
MVHQLSSVRSLTLGGHACTLSTLEIRSNTKIWRIPGISCSSIAATPLRRSYTSRLRFSTRFSNTVIV